MSDPLPPPRLPGVDPVEPPLTTIDVIELTPATPGAGPPTVTLPDGTRLVQGSDGVFVPDPTPVLPPVAAHTVLGFKGLLATIATLSTVAIVAVAVARDDDPPAPIPSATTITVAATVAPPGATTSPVVDVTVLAPGDAGGGPAIALIVSTIDYCLSTTTFTDAEKVQVKGELSFSAAPTALPEVWVVTISNVGAGRDGDWTVNISTGDIAPVMPLGANNIYFDLQWCMHSDTLGIG